MCIQYQQRDILYNLILYIALYIISKKNIDGNIINCPLRACFYKAYQYTYLKPYRHLIE